MLPDLSEIRSKRKKSDMTQTELSRRTGVSQSLIAKIESGEVVPSYDKAKKIFDFFEGTSQNTQMLARDFMTPKVVSIKPQATLRETIKAMQKLAVSQLPVIEDGKIIGTVSEKALLERMNSAHDMAEVSKTCVQQVMGEAMPIIREDLPFRVVSALLEHNSGVLVARKGRPIGIITKADLLKAVIEEKKKGN